VTRTPFDAPGVRETAELGHAMYLDTLSDEQLRLRAADPRAAAVLAKRMKAREAVAACR